MTKIISTIFTVLLICSTTVAMAQFAGKKEGKKPRQDGKKFSLFGGGNKGQSSPKTGFKGEAPQWQLGIKGGDLFLKRNSSPKFVITS
jgi:hypothetical protein